MSQAKRMMQCNSVTTDIVASSAATTIKPKRGATNSNVVLRHVDYVHVNVHLIILNAIYFR